MARAFQAACHFLQKRLILRNFALSTFKISEALKKILSFLKAHPIVANLIYIFIAAWIIFTGALFFLDYWTHHGEVSVVPSLKGMNYDDARRELQQRNFAVELSDSIYDSTYPAGTVVEQSPRANAKVKDGRTVYLTIVAYSPRMVTVPYFMNTSLRQGRSMFEGLGIRNVKIVEVESEYKDLVLAAKFNGLPLKPGARIPVTATVTLEVGKGYEPFADEESEDEIIIEEQE